MTREAPLSDYLVRVGVPQEVVERRAHAYYDLQFGRSGVEAGDWTEEQLATALHLQAMDREDWAAAAEWLGVSSSLRAKARAAAIAQLGPRLAAIGGR